jgi:hypothetical protein
MRSAHAVSGRTWDVCARRVRPSCFLFVRPSDFFVLPGRTWYHPCAHTKTWAHKRSQMCARGTPRVRERDSCARCPSVCAVSFGVRVRRGERDFSGYRAVPNPLLKTYVHMPPDPHTEGRRAHRRRLRTSKDLCAHGGYHVRTSDFFCAPTFSCAHMAGTMCDLGAQKSQMCTQKVRWAHTTCTPSLMCAQKPHVRNAPLFSAVSVGQSSLHIGLLACSTRGRPPVLRRGAQALGNRLESATLCLCHGFNDVVFANFSAITGYLTTSCCRWAPQI